MATATRKKKTAVPKKRLMKTKRQIETVEDPAETSAESPEQVAPESSPEPDPSAEQLGSVAEAEQEDATNAKLDKANEWRQKVEDAEREVDAAEKEYLASKEETKDLKKSWEGKVLALRRVIREASDPQLPLPLKDDSAADQGAAACAASGESHRDVHMDTLGLLPRIVRALSEARLETVGQLADFINGNKRLTDVTGIGAVASEQIIDALNRFWSSQGDAAQAGDSEDEAGDAETDEDVEEEDAEDGE